MEAVLPKRPPMPEQIPPFVKSLLTIIDPDEKEGKKKLQQAVENALKHDVDVQVEWDITTADKFLQFAAGHLQWIPRERKDAGEIYRTLCLFYFILDQSPIRELQTKIHPDQIDRPLTTVSQWITMFAMRVGDFMNTTASLTKESLATFENAKDFHMEEAWYPPGGFETFNQLFCRYLIKGVRPIAGDNKVVVFPADVTFECQEAVGHDSNVTIKTLPWPISALLRGSAYEKSFAGGTWMHAFLGPADYHRQHAPVSGRVLEAKVIQGLCYLEVDVVPVPGTGRRTLKPHRGLLEPRQAWPGDPYDELEAPDTPGYQFIQTRGCIIIDSPVVGLVAVLPIGMAYVSSVNLSVQSRFNTNGTLPDYVNKGDEISNFQFGGSDIVVVFQSQPGVTITAEKGQHYRYGEQLATVNESF